MATWQYQLSEPPSDARSRELWMQHAAGFIIFEDVRRYAMEQIDPALAGEARVAAQKAIDDAVYGLMMVIDGVSGGVSNARHTVFIDFIVRLKECGESTAAEKQSTIDLREGDGMCMGFHGWREGDFGDAPVVVPRQKDEK